MRAAVTDVNNIMQVSRVRHEASSRRTLLRSGPKIATMVAEDGT